MKNKNIKILIFAVIGLIVASLSIFIGFEYLVEYNKWIGLIIGFIVMLIGAGIYQIGKKIKIFYQISFILNMIGVGLSITAYYVFKEYSLSFIDFIVAILISLVVIIGFNLFTNISFINKHKKLITAIVIFISFFLSLALWISVKDFSGLTFYFLNIIYFFMVASINDRDIEEVNKNMALISFGAFILVSIIVFIIISEGEALSGLDGADLGIGSKKKKENKQIL